VACKGKAARLIILGAATMSYHDIGATVALLSGLVAESILGYAAQAFLLRRCDSCSHGGPGSRRSANRPFLGLCGPHRRLYWRGWRAEGSGVKNGGLMRRPTCDGF
jgi:hypothetical protein